VTLRVYSHVLREHAAGVGDISPRPPRLVLANPLATRHGPHDHQQCLRCSDVVVRGGVEPPAFRFSGIGIAVYRGAGRSIRAAHPAA
jgi:hypothetical protein